MSLSSSSTLPQSERAIAACNFRASGLLSNESLRQLRSMHETLARMLAHSLDLSLGSTLDVKLLKVDQIGARELVSGLAPTSYLVPFAVDPGPDRVIARFDNTLLFPLLDLLLGGTGDPFEYEREVTEIDEELFRSVTELICAQLERAWKVLAVTVSPQPSIKPAMLSQMFAPEDRVVELELEIRIGADVRTSFAFILPMTLASSLVRSSQTESSRRSGIRPGSARGLQDRLLSCRMRVAAELPDLDIPLRELALLEPGTVLDLRVPAQTPVQLRISGYSSFDMLPVRQGNFKAAQLVRPRTEECA